MKFEVTEQQDRKKRLKFEIPQDVVMDELAKIYRQISSTAKVKGFRPGKVPKTIIKRFFWSQIESEVIKNLVPTYYQKVISEAALEPIGEPEFDDFFLEEGKALTIGVTLEVKPVLEPGDYTNIEVKWPKPEATDKDVADMLARLQEKNAQFEVVEGRPVRDGDIVVLGYTGKVENRPVDSKKTGDLQIEIKSGDEQNDLMKAVIGMSKDETKRIELTLPKDFPQKELREKNALLDVAIKEIKGKKLPNLDDEFARDLGEYDDLDALKTEIRKQIQSSLDKQAENIAREEISKVLIERNPFEPPESMIEEKLDNMISGIENQLRLGGSHLNTHNWDRNKFREELRPKAKRDVHLDLIQEGIARKESLNVPEEEIERQIELLSLQTRQDFNELKDKAKTNGTWERIRISLLADKAMDFVMDKAVRIEVPYEADKNIKDENINTSSG